MKILTLFFAFFQLTGAYNILTYGDIDRVIPYIKGHNTLAKGRKVFPEKITKKRENYDEKNIKETSGVKFAILSEKKNANKMPSGGFARMRRDRDKPNDESSEKNWYQVAAALGLPTSATTKVQHAFLKHM